MKFKILFLLIALFTSINSSKTITCIVETTEGSIVVELYADKAPVTVANFLKYVDGGLYENSSFFRVTTPENEATRTEKIEVIQGGTLTAEKQLPPIEIETTEKTGINHLDGTISMARSGPNSATSSFFICINEQPALDFAGKRNPDGYGFAAFGKVIKGMDVVRKIQKMESKKQQLVNPVAILTIKRLE
tara:strand:- start:142740 stop:143309 length:570 start_codon:yes stop_codon:yes gene_type:complete